MNRRAALFLLLYLASILYLSLYPWRFFPHPDLQVLIWVPLTSRRTILDAFLNVVFYIPLGAAVVASFRERGLFAFAAALFLGTITSFAVEVSQLFIPSRFGNLTDLFCNTLGTLIGATLAIVATSSPLATWWRTLYSPGGLLLGLWAVWQAFLFLPRYGPGVDISREIVGVLMLALLVVRRKIPFAAPVLLVWLAFEELRPFNFQGLLQNPQQRFLWLPFESWFVGALESYYGTFFGKLFLYTAILWAERKAGMSWIWALAAPGAILMAGEYAQCYLPGRTPESTDVVLLLAGAVLLQLAEPARRSRRVRRDNKKTHGSVR